MTTIQLRVHGLPGDISLWTLAVTAGSTRALLERIDAAISHEKTGSLDWHISDLRMGSIVVALKSEPRRTDINVGPQVAGAFVDAFAAVELRNEVPAFIDERGIVELKRLIGVIGRNGASGIDVEGADRKVEVTAQGQANLRTMLRPVYRSLGSVEGRIETISIHRRQRFVVYQSRTHKAVTCYVPTDQPELMKAAADAIGRRANIAGTVHSNRAGEPLKVDVQDIRVLRDRAELPDPMKLGGSDPDFTGKQSSVEYVRSMRVG